MLDTCFLLAGSWKTDSIVVYLLQRYTYVKETEGWQQWNVRAISVGMYKRSIHLHVAPMIMRTLYTTQTAVIYKEANQSTL